MGKRSDVRDPSGRKVAVDIEHGRYVDRYSVNSSGKADKLIGRVRNGTYYECDGHHFGAVTTGKKRRID